MTPKNPGLILKPAEPDHWLLGSGKASERFGGEDINPSGDWTAYKAQDEAQSRPNFETMGCADFGTLKAWIMLAKFLGFTDFTKDGSERYTGAFAGTSASGTDPQVVAEVTRTTCGLIPQEVMPWTEDIDSLEKYYDKHMAQSLLPLGSKLLDRFEFGHEWVFAFGSSYTPTEKRDLIRAALKRGPVCASVRAWKKKGKYYTKNKGEQDNHWIVVLNHTGTHAVIHDQYDPFVKELDTLYDFNAAKVYFLKRREEKTKTFWSTIWDLFGKLIHA